jgi:hypothetical protein
MKKLLLLLITLLFANYSFGDSKNTYLHFALNYAVVEHSLMGDRGNFKNLMLIHDTNPKRAESIAEFWTTKAQRECLDYLNNQLDLIMVKFKAIKDITEEQKKKFEKELSDEVANCHRGIYFENWDEINETIINSSSK